MPDKLLTSRSSDLAQIQIARATLRISDKDFHAILAETTGYETMAFLDEHGRREVLAHLNSLNPGDGLMIKDITTQSFRSVPSGEEGL